MGMGLDQFAIFFLTDSSKLFYMLNILYYLILPGTTSHILEQNLMLSLPSCSAHKPYPNLRPASDENTAEDI